MNGLISAQWLSLRTAPFGWAMPPLAAAAAVAMVLAASAAAGTGPNPPFVASDLPRVVATPSIVATTLALLAGVLFTTSEWRHATALDTFLRAPRRWPVVAAKTLVAAFGGVLTGAVAALVAGVAGWLAISSSGVTPSLPAGLLSEAAGGVVLASGLYAAFGAALGLLLRNQAAALVVALLWRTGIESAAVVVAGARDLADWLPAAAGATVASGGHGPTRFSLLAATALFAAYAGALALLAAWRTSQADVG